MNTRTLGTLCIGGGFAYIVMAIRGTITGSSSDSLSNVLGLIWILGAICGWLGFILARGSGHNVVARFLTFIPIIGLVLAAISGVYALATGADPFSVPTTGIGLILELVGSVLAAIFALAARTLAGWRRFTPLAIVLAVLVGGMISAAAPMPVLAIPLCLGIAYAALGYAVRTAADKPGVATLSAELR